MSGGYMPKPLFGPSDQSQNSTNAVKAEQKVTAATVSGPSKLVFNVSNRKYQEPVSAPPKAPQPQPLFVDNTKAVFKAATDSERKRFTGFDDVEISKIRHIAANTQITDRYSAIMFAHEVSSQLANEIDKVLEFMSSNVSSASIKDVAVRISRIINTDFSIPKVVVKNGFFGFGASSVEVPVETTVKESLGEVDASLKLLIGIKDSQLALIPKIDEMLKNSKRLFVQLSVHIAAGKELLSGFNRTERPKYEMQLKGSNVLDSQNARDHLEIFESFEKRLDTLAVIQAQSELSLEQIRITLGNCVRSVETINNIATSLIPLWKQGLMAELSMKSFKAGNEKAKAAVQAFDDLISSFS